MRTTITLLACCLALTAGQAQQVSAPDPVSTPELREELEELRMQVWVAWFSNDVRRLRAILAPELIAISPGDSSLFKGLPQTLEQSAAFKRNGGKLIALAFSNTETRVYGDVAVMYSGYQLTTEQAGKQTTTRGRATEVFVKRDGQWMHPSWHLD